VLFHPTTTVNILRGTGVNTFGDETDDQAPVAEGVPAHITEVRKNASGGSSSTPRVVRYFACRVAVTTDVQDGDRVEDTSTGAVYVIDSLTRPATGMPITDVRIDLRKVS
jgi:hypothetical protein